MLKEAAEQARVNKLWRTKMQRVFKGFDNRAGWNYVRQLLFYFAKFVINYLNKYISQFYYYFNTFYFPLYSMK